MKKRIVSLFVACLIILTIPVYAATESQLKKELKQTEKTQEETEKKLDAKKASVEELKGEIEKLDKNIAAVEKEIQTIQNDINSTEQKLDKVADELEKAVKEKEEQKATLDERLRVMYMYSDTNTFDILFSATSFSDLISKFDAIKTIAEFDQEVFEELEIMEKEIAAKKEEIEKKKANLLTLKKESETKKTGLNQVKVDRSSYMAELKKDTQKLESELNQLESESSSIESQINSLTAPNSSSGNQNTNITSGQYLWPVPGHTGISSPYGYRTHPILGYKKFHSGIDIPTGRRKGVNAIAVGAGVVIKSSYSSGYGNNIIIDLGRDSNGNSVTAVYAHLAKRYLSAGANVSAGQAVGEVGTTGLSTGIHLHFEIRINGATRNPVSYVR